MKTVRPIPYAAVYLLLYLAAANVFPAFGQGRKYEGRRIATIQFVPPAQPLEAAELNEILPLRIGETLTMTGVQASIERLFATGRYEDIQVDAQMHGEQVVVRFITRESHFIGHVSVTNGVSEPPNAGQLVNAARLDLGQPFTEEKMAAAQEGIKRLLDANGLYRSRVRAEYQYDPLAQQVHVRFLVDSGDRANFAPPELRGELKVPRDKLISATGWRRWLIGSWKPVTQSRVRSGIEGIREVYEKQDRLQAKVALESMTYDDDSNRARPVVAIDAGPRIQVRTIGAKVSDKKLRRFIPIYEEHTVDRELLVEGARNLRDYFQSQGYFEAEVEPKEQRVTNDQATIDYLINTGRRHKLVHIEIQGNRYFSTETLRERMFMQTASLLQYRRGRFSGSLLRRDEEAIADLYESNGFRDVSVTSRIADSYRGKAGEIAVFMKVEEGPQWFVNRLEIEGVESLDAMALRGMMSSVEGQPFSEYNVSVDRDTILSQYFSQGFPNAAFEWSWSQAAEPNQVNLRFVIREGRRQVVRQVLITGLKDTSPQLVARNILLNPGDPLSPNRMIETQRRLYDLGVFAKVDAAIQNPDGQTDRKYVQYDMEEASKYSVAVGFGAEIARIGGCETCLQAAAGEADFAPRVSFNVSRLNLWGLAHTISLRTRASTLEQRGLLTYAWPRFYSRDALDLSFTGLYEKSLNVRTFTSKRQEVSAQITQRFSKATTFLYRYAYRRVSVDQGTLKISPLLIPQFVQPVRLGMLSLNAIQDRRDDPLDPTKGIFNTLDLGIAERIVGAQRNFFRFLGRNATYHPLSRRFTLARNTSFGVLHPFRYTGDVFEAIPLPERFFSGGASSHRGFPEAQAGPRDLVTGFPLGGTALLFNQTELRFPLIGDNIGAVLFHDAGNVYSSVGNISARFSQRNDQDFDYMVHAAGIGLRYRTPIGPVRVDLAYSINPPRFFGFKADDRQELIEAGPEPCVARPDRCVLQRLSRFQFFFSIGQTF